ncbi:MAG: hypothetical protein HY679_12335 [Chloroflexi bacterium]|nr:hypothetical protein [Chloroflexota bacterium]
MLGPLCTNDGYVIVERSITPVLWPKLAEARTVMQAAQVMAQDTGIVVGGFSPIGGPWQIRAAQVTVDESALWPTMTSSAFTANIMLGQQEGEWRFVSFASSDQVNRLIQSKGDQSR